MAKRSQGVRKRFAILLGVVAVIGATTFSASATPTQVVAARTSCPAGTEKSTSLTAFAAGGGCQTKRPEDSRDAVASQSALTQRDTDGGLAEPAEAKLAAAVASAALPVATTATDWAPYGIGPQKFDDATYDQQDGLEDISGRIQSIIADPLLPDSHQWVGVASGGIWETLDSGATWHDVSASLPTQVVGAVGYTTDPGGNPTLIAGTGDPAFGGSSFSGLGFFWSSNDGATWNRASVPGNTDVGTITFRIRVDPSVADGSVLYGATGKGLYRSTDYGRSWTDVMLPTTCTSKTDELCFFANIVSDVVVRPNDKDGTGGGKVLAAVGWRAGEKLNQVGKPQAPQDGIYESDSGLPGSFTFQAPGSATNVGGNQFPDPTIAGRTALAVATGINQDHDYVYAEVEDAQKFNGTDETQPTVAGVTPGLTYLNGIYGSTDFGTTWTLLANSQQLKTPVVTGSALDGAMSATGYAPGVQAWYNEWIDVDPNEIDTSDVTGVGVPGYLAFGLEEVWAGSGRIVASNTGLFQVIGKYFAGPDCEVVALPVSGACPTSPTSYAPSTTHPDQHAGLFVPGPGERTTLLIGNDGGFYRQTQNIGTTFDNADWGRGSQGSVVNGANLVMHTLLPYDVVIANDGTVYGGLQDNGDLKIDPKTQAQYAIYGGDGFFAGVDPSNSDITYEEYTYGDISVSQDGGATFSGISPGLTSSQFATPFVLDAHDANHLVTGGREIKEDVVGPTGTWTTSYDLGTRTQPGNANATADVTDPNNGDPNNSTSALTNDGAADYVGYCGACDIVTGTRPFTSGVATNVGGSKPPAVGSSDGWHIAAAKGLPQREILDMAIDPADHSTVYAVLGGYGRRWIPPGALGDDTSKIGEGHVFVSHDAGATFTDISGDLPDEPADTVLVQGNRLLVGTNTGVFISTPAGGTWSTLADGMPKVPVFKLSFKPNDANALYAATMGRGVYIINLTATTVGVAPGTPAVPGTPGSVPPVAVKGGTGSLASTGLPWVVFGAPLLLLTAWGLRRRAASR